MATFLSNIRLQSLLLFSLAFLLYANTLGHDFVADDQVVLTQNRLVQSGLQGIPAIFSEDSFAGFLPEGVTNNPLDGGRYRPLSLVCFAILHQIFGANSLVFHLFTVLLYALTCLALYRFLLLALKPAREQSTAMLTALGATLLFVTHPVHTEVAANVKSCDEQLALLGGLGALYAVLKAYDNGSWKWALGAGGLFFLACLAKENAAAIWLLAPLTLWFFRGKHLNPPVENMETETVEPVVKKRTWNSLPALASLTLAFGVYIVVRGVALDWYFAGQSMLDPLNNPFLKSNGQQWVPFSTDEKTATILFTLFQYARLLVWPHPLTHDYYPFQIEPQSFHQLPVVAAMVVYGLVLILAIWGLWKQKPAAYGLFFYLLPLLAVSNLFFPVGTFMAERFLFMPSVGFCFALTAILVGLVYRFKPSPAVAVAPVLVLGLISGTMSVLRNPAWSTNKSLLQADLPVSSNSAKLRNSLGTVLLAEAQQTTDPAQRRALLEESEKHLKRAIELHPTYYDAILAYGACSFYLENYDMSVAAYRGAGRLNPQDSKNTDGLAFALRYGGEFYARRRRDPERAVGYLMEAWQLTPDTAIASTLALQYETMGRPGEAAQWLEKALALAPNDPGLLNALVKAYTAAGDKAKAAEVAERAKSFTSFGPGSN